MLNSALGHILWPIATRRIHQVSGDIVRAPCPSTAKRLVSKLTTRSDENWNQIWFSLLISGQQVEISIASIDESRVLSENRVELTFVPKYLMNAHVTLLIGDASETTTLRLVFVTGERVEMKELDTSLTSILWRFSTVWGKWETNIARQGHELEWLERISEAQEDKEDSCSTLSLDSASRSASPA